MMRSKQFDHFETLDQFKAEWNIHQDWTSTIAKRSESHVLILYRRTDTDLQFAIEEESGKVIRYKIFSPFWGQLQHPPWEKWRTYDLGKTFLLKAINDHVGHLNRLWSRQFKKALSDEAKRKAEEKRFAEREEQRKTAQRKRLEHEKLMLSKGDAYQKDLLKKAGHKPCTQAEAARYLGISVSRVAVLLKQWDFPKVWVSQTYIDRDGLEEYKQKREAKKAKKGGGAK